MIWSNFEIWPYSKIHKGNLVNLTKPELIEYLGLKDVPNDALKHVPTKVLRNCVHPEIGNHILSQATKKQGQLF